MNEKSKAFELIEFVWNNEKTDSYLRVNIAMYEAVKLAIISQMKFNKEDFQNIRKIARNRMPNIKIQRWLLVWSQRQR